MKRVLCAAIAFACCLLLLPAGVVARNPVTLVVGAQAPAKPAVETVSGQVNRGRLIGEDPPLELPLDVREGEPALEPGQSLGFLSGDEGGVAQVRLADGKLEAVEPGLAQTELVVTGIDRSGNYSGTLDLTPEDGGTFELKLEVDAWVGWALLALIPGIILALVLRHLRGVARSALALLLDETEMREKVTKAHSQFVSDSQGKRWEGYSTIDAFNREADALRADLVKLGRASFDQLDEERRTELVGRIVQLEGHAAKLEGLGPALAGLDEALAAVNQGPVAGITGAAVPPVFVAGAALLLKGHRLDSLDELDELLDDVAKATRLALRWPRLYAEAERAAQRVSAAPAGAATDEAKSKLAGSWVVLSEAADSDAVADRKLDDRFTEALVLAAGLPAARQVSAPVVRGRASAATATAAPTIVRMPVLPTFGSIVGRLPTTSTARLRVLRNTIRWADWVQILVAALLAIYSGLAALYWGQTFGGWQDYVAAFLWGSITAGAIDAVAEAIRTRVGPISAR